jgi:pimeloyl-ACP methyl ester carboxylesterase
MLKYTDGYLKLDDVRIHYYRTGGKKPSFILLHGAMDNGLCWTPVAEWLTEKYDVIMPDAQGHGLSDRLSKDFTFKTLAQLTAGLSLGLGLTRPIILGHSMGADTAATIAVEYPSLAKAIILEDPPWMTMDSPEAVDEEKAGQRDAFMKSFAEIGKQPLKKIITEGRKLNPGWSEEELKPWAESKRQFDPDLFKKPLLNVRSYEELVPEIKCPTLLIIADAGIVSKNTAENAAKLWKSKLPFKWVQIKGAGHNIRREQFKAFKDAISGFLKNLPA